MSKSDPTHYELYYYNSRGFAEPIRMLLAYGGASFNDNRTPVLSFTPITPLPSKWRERSLFGQVPILEFEGKTLTQSLAITRYLARKYELVGRDEFEAAKCDELVDGIRDFFTLWLSFYYEEGDQNKSEAKEHAMEVSKQRYLPVFNKLVASNDGVHLVGDRLTWPDIYLANFLDHLPRITQIDVPGSYPALLALMKNVFSVPGIKEWYEQRPNTPF